MIFNAIYEIPAKQVQIGLCLYSIESAKTKWVLQNEEYSIRGYQIHCSLNV